MKLSIPLRQRSWTGEMPRYNVAYIHKLNQYEMSNKKEKPKSDLNIEPLSYPASEDIYNNQKEEENIDSENPKRNKTAN